ncbi:MAG: helix-turn-helix domain-containing protein [Trebonia sp.]
MAAEPGAPAGAQTLARGLAALELVAAAENGMTVGEVAERLGVHRTIASRLLCALAGRRLIARDAGGRYRVGSGLIALARQYEPLLKTAASGVLRHLADKLGATALATVHDGDSAVAVTVAEPAGLVAHLAYRPGHRSPLDRGAAAYALRSQLTPEAGEPPGVARARRDKYAIAHGEVTAGAYGVAAPIPRAPGERPACVLLITVDRTLAESALPAVTDAARQISALLA